VSSLTLTGAGPELATVFTPSSIGGLTAWLKADAGTSTTTDGVGIATWSDQSGSANDATQATGAAQPLYKTAIQNGLPIVRFDKVQSRFFGMPTLAALTAGTVFIVVATATDPGSGDNTGLWKLGTSGDMFFPFTDGIVYDDCGSTVRKTTVNPTPALTAFHVYEVSSAAGAWTNWLDGAQLFTTATNTVAFSATPTLGKTAAQFFSGDIGELLIYNSALSAGNRQSVEAYLKAKWGTP
jgi:hypothetical protein